MALSFVQSGRRKPEALSQGKTDPAEIALLAGRNLRATQAQLCDALSPVRELNPVYRNSCNTSPEELRIVDKQI